MVLHRALFAALALAVAAPGVAGAQAPVLDRSVAVWQFDALGIEPEIVARLESLFRTELERMAQQPMPSRREVNRRIGRRLARCGGETDCLTAIGKKVGVDLVITGNVAALGDSYVFNLKVIDVAAGAELRRVQSDPLRGNPDELIDAVRVAAYRLVAPEQLRGSIAVLTDLIGASVYLDDRLIGVTPLPGPIEDLPLGDHALRVEAKGYSPFAETVQVRFQKTTRVVVRLVLAPAAGGVAFGGEPGGERDRRRWYQSTWFYVAVGVSAAVLGGVVGYGLAHDDVTDCTASPMACE